MKITTKYKKLCFVSILMLGLGTINSGVACPMYKQEVSAALNTVEWVMYCGTPGNFTCCIPRGSEGEE